MLAQDADELPRRAASNGDAWLPGEWGNQAKVPLKGAAANLQAAWTTAPTLIEYLSDRLEKQ